MEVTLGGKKRRGEEDEKRKLESGEELTKETRLCATFLRLF